MGGLQVALEVVLVALLGAALLQALRLERAIGAARRDRAEMEGLAQGLDDAARQAEGGVERLRATADAAGRAMTRQIEAAANLKDDLADLIGRGERLSGRLGAMPRAEPEPAAPPGGPRARSQAERDLLRALRVAQ